MSKINIALSIIISALFLGGCELNKKEKFSFAFYNVENLFDTIADPTINDTSFLPSSVVSWNTQRYQNKLENISRVISSIDSTGFPSVFGLAEVENEAVLKELISSKNLKKADYQILHENSPDERGIDVALLYRPGQFKPIKTSYIELDFPFDSIQRTREILYCKGLVNKTDTLHLFINHWVSRWGGQQETEAFRQYTGKILKLMTDSIFNHSPEANIIIAGDLNDNPNDPSVAKSLNALLPEMPLFNSTLYNLSLKQYNAGKGTLFYNNRWDMFDQIIVSTAILDGSNGIKSTSTDQIVIKKEWMLYQPKEGEARPSRTASGTKYYGGFSDHLPVYLEMEAAN